MVRPWPGRAEQDLLMGHQSGQPHRVHPDASRTRHRRGRPPRPPSRWRRPGTRLFRPSARAAAMPSAVRSEVPDGASRLASWWSSTISALSNHGAASAAKRIISTAPMAKLAATMQLAPVDPASGHEQLGQVVEVGLGEPGRPHHGVDAGRRTEGQRGPGGLEMGEVDDHLDAGRRQRGQRRRTPSPTPRRAASVAEQLGRRWSPAYSGVDRGHQFESRPGSTARHTSRPIRPPAPTTPTRMSVTLAKPSGDTGAPWRPALGRPSVIHSSANPESPVTALRSADTSTIARGRPGRTGSWRRPRCSDGWWARPRRQAGRTRLS